MTKLMNLPIENLMTKVCIKKDKCANPDGAEQPLTSFHKNKINKDGLRGECKSCKKILAKRWRQENADRIAAYKKQYYIENPDKAEEQKTRLREYSKRLDIKAVRVIYKKQYWEDNKDEINSLRNKKYATDLEFREEKKDKTKQYFANNKDKVIAYRTQYRCEHKDEINELQRQRYAANPDNIKEGNRQWRISNPSKINVYSAKRRAAKLERTPVYADHWKIEQYYIMARKLKDLYGISFHVDHRIPLQGEMVSGFHVHNNLEIITATENHVKNNRFEPIFGI